MTKRRIAFCTLILLLVIAFANTSSACSMFKITHHGKTMVGNNEDAWRYGSRLVFTPGKDGKYGMVSTMHRGNLPQGGMNEYGLMYDGLTVPSRILKAQSGKKEFLFRQINDEIMSSCKTVDEVYLFLQAYNLSSFNGGMPVFVDAMGNYLVIEADTLIKGNDPKYVISNFCPSQTPDLSKVIQQRYHRGSRFLENKADSSLAFCTAMMDTMHECRERMGDGTLYTSIYDLNDGIIYIHFYHDFTHVAKFDLKAELAKGTHTVDMESLFPPNAEYQKLKEYITPHSRPWLLHSFILLLPFFLFSAIFFAIGFIRYKTRPQPYGIYKLLLSIISLLLLWYIYLMLNNEVIFFFKAPCKIFPGPSLLNLMSYLPLMLLAFILPIAYTNVQVIHQKAWSWFAIAWLTLNTGVYVVLLGFFIYWGLFDVFR
jgi:hypothetical protein